MVFFFLLFLCSFLPTHFFRVGILQMAVFGLLCTLYYHPSIFLSQNYCMLSHFSYIQLFETLWTLCCQAPLSMGFSRQEYWSEFPLLSLGDLPDPGSNPRLLCLLNWQADFLPLAPPGKPLTLKGHKMLPSQKI